MNKEDVTLDLSDLSVKAGLADYSPVKGCMVIKPYGYRIWELIQAELDKRIKAKGYDNAYFPLLIPESFLKKEADHVEGFAPECAVVTHAGGSELEEPLVIRPTSETIIYHMYAKWIKSWRDLPFGVNQWANVLRWEKRTRLFLRTTEFLWQEGHTCHANEEDADTTARAMLNVYHDFMRSHLALAPIVGEKSESERFAGAQKTYSLEVLLRDGKILQAGTSHYLGDGFAKAFEIQYQDPDNNLQYAHLTSWGVSTRLIGALIMGHKDDIGLILPPKIAPHQVVIIPIYRKDTEKEAVLSSCNELSSQLQEQGIRVHLDDNDQNSPGYKFNEWELKGAPLRVHIGPRDLENNVVELARRDTREKIKGAAREGIVETISNLLTEIQDNLLKRQEDWCSENTHEVSSLEEANQILDEKGGFLRMHWSETAESENLLKEKTKATIRVKAFDEEKSEGNCAISGQPSKVKYYAGRAY